MILWSLPKDFNKLEPTLCQNMSSFGGMILEKNVFKLPHPIFKNNFHQVWLKLTCWFWRTRDVCETLMPPSDIHYRVHNPLFWAWMETANNWNFSKSKGNNSVQNGSFVPKTKLDLDIPMINLCIKFHLNERKLQIIRIFWSFM
jgi:hypothetical protein